MASVKHAAPSVSSAAASFLARFAGIALVGWQTAVQRANTLCRFLQNGLQQQGST